MTTFNKLGDRNRDLQDQNERAIWKKLEYVDGGGAILKLDGTGTEEEEVVLMNSGYGMNVPEGYDGEVLMVSYGSDTTQKFAIPMIQHDKQRKWKENTGGIQNPTDPEKAVEFNAKRTHVTEDNFAVGLAGLFEIKNGVAYLRVPLHCPVIHTTPGGPPVIPGFDA